MALQLQPQPQPIKQRAPSPVVTKGDWQQWKSRIVQLYPGHTLCAILQTLHDEGFRPTIRMLKAKVAEWGIDTKSMKYIEYEAMYMQWQECQEQGQEVYFSAVVASGQKFYTAKEISKALGRKGGADVRKENRKVIRKEGDAKIFERMNITVHEKTTAKKIGKALGRKGGAAVREENRTSIPEQGRAKKLGRTNTTVHKKTTAKKGGAAVREENRTSIPEQGCAGRLERVGVAVHGEATATAVPVSPSFASSDSGGSSSALVSTSDSDSPQLPLPLANVQRLKLTNIEIGAAFARLPYAGFSPLLSEVSWVLQHDTTQSQEEQASQWLCHVFCTNIEHNRFQFPLASKHRATALSYFGQMLRSRNPRILTSLLHISMTLSALGLKENYCNFLEDCCRVIDCYQIIQAVNDSSSGFLTLYRYALACERRDDTAIESTFNELRCSIEENCRNFLHHGGPTDGNLTWRICSELIVCSGRISVAVGTDAKRDWEKKVDVLFRV